jgi:hypothetical protein
MRHEERLKLYKQQKTTALEIASKRGYLLSSHAPNHHHPHPQSLGCCSPFCCVASWLIWTAMGVLFASGLAPRQWRWWSRWIVCHAAPTPKMVMMVMVVFKMLVTLIATLGMLVIIMVMTKLLMKHEFL